MRLHRYIFFLAMSSLFWSVLICWKVKAEDRTSLLSLDLNAAINQALQENPDLKAKRQALGLARGRVQQADLLFQENPQLSVDIDYRHRRFAAPTGRSVADAEVRLTQEIEIAGQRHHRREAAAKHLTQAEWLVADAERLLRWEVARGFYDLLAARARLAVQRQFVHAQDALLRAGVQRFAREDISVIELDTLRLDRDRAQSELATREIEETLAEQQLRLLLGLDADTAFTAVGDLWASAPGQEAAGTFPPRESLEACALAHRPDLQAARLALGVREAELRLARANRIPNISLGPLYKSDNEDQVVGAGILIPLPLFDRNQHEITAALANLETARTEFAARGQVIRQEVASAYTRLRLTADRVALYGRSYLDDVTRSVTFTQKAYEAGELSIFEFSVAQDRFAQARLRYIDAVAAYLHAVAELEVRSTAACLGPPTPPAGQPQGGTKRQ